MIEQLRPAETVSSQFALEVPGVVRISHLASTPEGFTLKTRETLRMKEGLTKEERQPEEFAKGTPLRQKATDEMRQEVLRTLKQVIQVSQEDEEIFKKTIRTPEDNDKIHNLLQTLTPEQHKQYTDLLLTTRKTGFRSARKVGIENIIVEDNTITADVKTPYYRMYAAIPPTASQEAREFAHPAAVAMVVQTSDGRLVLQYRKPFEKDPETGKTSGNRFYGGIPGASAAGMFDAPRGPHGTGKPGNVGNQEVVNMAIREAKEELGLTAEDLTHVAITGVAQDLLKPHDELLLFAKTARTAKEMRGLHISEETAQSEYDFAETFYTIPSTPDAVERLLTQVHVPLPPTHVAAYFAAGNALAIEQLGPEKAQAWSARVAKGIQENFSYIDALVETYWLKRKADIAAIEDPEEKAQQEQRLSEQTKDITTHKYDPSLSAAQQGLPELSDELERTELLERTVKSAWLFDIDGVITNPDKKEVVEEEIITHLVERLKEKQPIALVTGRALSWVDQKVIERIRQKILQEGLATSLLDNLYVSGEFGGSTMIFEDGKVTRENSTISLPHEVIEGAKAITDEYAGIVFTDTEKQTQYTAELQDNVPVATFHTGPQEEITHRYEHLLQELAQKGVDVSSLEVVADRIAINIRDKRANKKYATEQFLKWLKEKNITAQRFYAFGDSKSDLEMGDELYRKSLPFTFYFVGNPAEIAGRMTKFWVTFPMEIPNSHETDRGTASILSTLDEDNPPQGIPS